MDDYYDDLLGKGPGDFDMFSKSIHVKYVGEDKVVVEVTKGDPQPQVEAKEEDVKREWSNLGKSKGGEDDPFA